MPNLPAHIELANRAAERLGHPALEPYMGYFLLGSTSPDVRAITHGQREKYHFAPLDFGAVGAGVEGFFKANPQLKALRIEHGPTWAFVAGYLTHLVLDEVWIVEMYRPYFGNPLVFQDEVYGMVMDRALQLELDRMSQETVGAAVPLLARVSDRVDVGFIPTETLAAWHRFVLRFMEREFEWDRLRFMARRIAAGDDGHAAHRVAVEFLRTMPASLERLYQLVSRDDLVRFKQQATETLACTVEDYLS